MNIELIAYALIGAIFLFGLWELYFTCFRHAKLLAVKTSEANAPKSTKPISVIISARNEATNLEAYLPSILTQNYAEYEVIVVNDRSWDGTDEVLKSLCLNYSNLRVVTITHNDKFIAGKKFAISMGIKAAKYDWLVFTDADCMVNSPDWLAYMQDPDDEITEIKLGYSPYFKKSSFLNWMIRYETFHTALNYLTFALAGNPYMGVGRNMAYKKSLFFKSKGFASHMHIQSGDDDLFINKNATSSNTQIVIAKDSQVWSAPKLSWMDYVRQKKRHRGAGTTYKTKHRVILTIQFLLPFIFFALSIVGLVFEQTRLYTIGTIVFVYLIKAIIYPRLYSKLSYGELKWFFPILDILYLIFTVITGFIGMFVKRGQWK